MKENGQNMELIFLVFSVIFLISNLFDVESLIFIIPRSIIGLFLGIVVVGNEIRNWIFRSSTSNLDFYEVFAINIAFSISFLIFFGGILSYFDLFTSFTLNVSLATLIVLSLLLRFFLKIPKQTEFLN